VVYVDVDAVGDVDVGGVSTEAQLTPEKIQEHQHHDYQQDDRQKAAASAATCFHDGRVLALHIIAIIGHWKLSLFMLLLRNERTAFEAVPG
jgi:hypothetical protein